MSTGNVSLDILLGEILEYDPLAELHDEELKCIKFLDVEINQTKTAIERFREIRSRKISDENVTYVKNFLRNKITIDVDSSIPFLIGWGWWLHRR